MINRTFVECLSLAEAQTDGYGASEGCGKSWCYRRSGRPVSRGMRWGKMPSMTEDRLARPDAEPIGPRTFLRTLPNTPRAIGISESCRVISGGGFGLRSRSVKALRKGGPMHKQASRPAGHSPLDPNRPKSAAINIRLKPDFQHCRGSSITGAAIYLATVLPEHRHLCR